jgi:3'-phosphoadenosine 5'-phosphosulfate sulfotransferase (PAPS reductase)/FAD synthetase
LNIAEQYRKEVLPIKVPYIDKRGKEKEKLTGTRASKETRYAHFQIHKNSSLKEKERWSIELLKMALQNAKNPVVSCSFGIDSIIDIYLTRKALIELGRDPSDIDIVWNDTANEFKEVRQYQKYITDLWNLRLTVTKPKKTLKHIIDDNGGITDDYFTARKGDRRHGRPLSEKCCGTLKHEPMKRITEERGWDLLIVGLRADESRQRLQAGLRDGEYFYSITEWKAYVCRPILWWLEKDIWEYVEQENIPYNDLYKMNLIQEYPENAEEIVYKNKNIIEEYGLDYYDLGDRQTQTVNRKQAMLLEKLGFKIFTPRTGWYTAV